MIKVKILTIICGGNCGFSLENLYGESNKNVGENRALFF